MLPVIIQDYITKLTDKTTHPEKRQHFLTTLITIRAAVDAAIKDYETEKHFRK